MPERNVSPQRSPSIFSHGRRAAYAIHQPQISAKGEAYLRFGVWCDDDHIHREHVVSRLSDWWINSR